METEFLETAETAARRAADVLADWSERFTVDEKSPFNLVTEADLASQQAIESLIRDRYPEHGILGEEDNLNDAAGTRFRWIVDPLDGTTNYVHRFPYYAVSIALECDGELIVGVVYDPSRDEMFAASSTIAATVNGRPLQPSRVSELGRAMCVASLPVDPAPNDPAISRFLNVLQKAQTVQRLGSAALNLAYVAAGRLDAFWSTSLKPWDMAAGVLIVERSGGRVTTTGGNRFRVDVPDLLATNGSAIHDELQTLFA